MRFVIVTGMSGAGKSSAMKILEDDGFFCVDNLPVSLLATFIELTEGSSEPLERVALGLDIRAGHNSGGSRSGDRVLEKGRLYAEILFMEAETKVLVKRYKETRRMHPLAKGGRMAAAIEEERECLKDLKNRLIIL